MDRIIAFIQNGSPLFLGIATGMVVLGIIKWMIKREAEK